VRDDTLSASYGNALQRRNHILHKVGHNQNSFSVSAADLGGNLDATILL